MVRRAEQLQHEEEEAFDSESGQPRNPTLHRQSRSQRQNPRYRSLPLSSTRPSDAGETEAPAAASLHVLPAHLHPPDQSTSRRGVPHDEGNRARFFPPHASASHPHETQVPAAASLLAPSSSHFHPSYQPRHHPSSIHDMHGVPPAEFYPPPQVSSSWPFEVPGMRPDGMPQEHASYATAAPTTAASPALTENERNPPRSGFASSIRDVDSKEDASRGPADKNAGAAPLSRKRPAPTVLEASSTPPQTTARGKKGKKSSESKLIKRFFWPGDLHRDFVSAIFDIGLKHASAASLMEKLGEEDEECSDDRVRSQLECYRTLRKSVVLRRADEAAAAKPPKSTRTTAKSQPANSSSSEPTAHSQSPVVAVSEKSKQQSSALTATTTSASAASSNSDVLITSKHVAAASRKNSSENKESTEDHRKKAAEPSFTYFEFPLFTEEERQSPSASFLGYLVGVMSMLTKELQEDRAAKAAAAAGTNAPPSDGDRKPAAVNLGDGYDGRHSPGPHVHGVAQLMPSSTNANHATAMPIRAVGGLTKEDTAAQEDAKQSSFDAFVSTSFAPSPLVLGFTDQHHQPHRQSFFPDDEESVSPRLVGMNSFTSTGDGGNEDHFHPDLSFHYDHHQYRHLPPHPTLPTHHQQQHSGHPNEPGELDTDEEHLFDSLTAYCTNAFSKASTSDRTE